MRLEKREQCSSFVYLDGTFCFIFLLTLAILKKNNKKLQPQTYFTKPKTWKHHIVKKLINQPGSTVSKRRLTCFRLASLSGKWENTVNSAWVSRPAISKHTGRRQESDLQRPCAEMPWPVDMYHLQQLICIRITPARVSSMRWSCVCGG